LTKNGKTINDLQEKLKEKKFYSGEITGKFDEATLEAVFAFQKSVKHPVYGEK
jgi:peptidoglycan hydrolase-like protein with peptidoglycan-binding domain